MKLSQPSLSKRCSLQELKSAYPFETRDKDIVLANGVFDLFHVGHLRYLEAAAQEASILVVAINSDASTRGYKGPGRPIVPEDERAEIICSLTCVDHVLVFDSPTVVPILEALRPNVHAKGTDYSPETVPEAPIVSHYGGRVAICGDPKNHSSTEIIKKTNQNP